MSKVSASSAVVSVVVPVLNGERFLREALESVLGQSYRRLEIVVVDDGSTDTSMSIVSSLIARYPRTIRLFRHPKRANLGIAASRNLGIRKSKAPWIAFLDQDDVWTKDKLEVQMASARAAPDAGLMYGKARFVNTRSETIRWRGFSEFGRPISDVPRVAFEMLLQENVIPSGTVMVRRSCLDEIGLFDEGPRHEYEDWLLWCKLAWKFRFLFVPGPHVLYRIHELNYSIGRTSGRMDIDAEAHFLESLFRFVRSSNSGPYENLLKKSITRLFLRARSWGYRLNEYPPLVNRLVAEFPEVRRFVRLRSIGIAVLPVFAAKAGRRLRRRIIGA